MTITISTKDLAKPVVKRLARMLASPALIANAAANGALPVVKRHFAGLSRSNRNRFGARSTFWNRMNSGTRIAPGTSRISMPREMALRYFGGTVKPTGGKKYLTIPLRAESYGKSIRQFNGIQFARFGGRLFAFTRDVASAGGRRGVTGARGSAALTILYLLTPSVTITGNSNVIPTPDELRGGAGRGAQSYIDAQLAKARAAAATTGGAE